MQTQFVLLQLAVLVVTWYCHYVGMPHYHFDFFICNSLLCLCLFWVS